MTFADTSGWYASLVPSDRDHQRAVGWLDGFTGRLLTTDYVIDETLTLLRSRGQGLAALDWGSVVLAPDGPVTIHYLTVAELARAWDVFRRYGDKDWSFTDCTSKVVIEARGMPEAFTFDRQFGTVAVVP